MSALALAEICRSTGCAIAREAALPRLFVHISAFAGISGMLSPNILVLRAMSILSSASAMAFNLANGLLSPVIWNLTFIMVNTARLAQLLSAKSSSVTLDANEQRLFELGFAQFGVTLKDYAALLREAKAHWREYAAGEVVVSAGDPMPLLWYVVEGEVEVIRPDGDTGNVLQPGNGGWLGELWDPNQDEDYWNRPHHWLAGFRAKSHSLLVALDRKALHDVIAKSHALRTAANAAEVKDLWSKLRSCSKQSVVNAYKGMQDMAYLDRRVDQRESLELERYAARHRRLLTEDDRRLLDERAREDAAEVLAHLTDPPQDVDLEPSFEG